MTQSFNNINMSKQEKISKQNIPDLLQLYSPQYKKDQLQIRQTFGMTNQTYIVRQEGLKTVLFRILSPILDRQYQNKVLQTLSASKLSPKAYFACEKYRIQEFIQNAQSPTSDQINSNKILLKSILCQLYRLHQHQLPKELQRSFFKDVVFTENKKKIYLNEKCKQQQQKKTQFETLKLKLLDEFDKLHQKVLNFKNKRLELSFSHNDLNNNNILIQQKNSIQKTFLIDFQYSCYNYVSYDIANLLNQCCFEYNEQVPGFKVKKRISDEQISQACNMYPGKYEGIQNDVKFMLMMCNYFWALWSLEATSSKTFSPTQHGKTRYQLYKFYSQMISQN